MFSLKLKQIIKQIKTYNIKAQINDHEAGDFLMFPMTLTYTER